MDISFWVSVAGLGFSVWAVADARKAKRDAKRAVETVVARTGRDDDRLRLKKLGDILRQAAAVARTYSGSTGLRRIGLRENQSDDIQLLKAAESALRADFPLSADREAEEKARDAAAEIARCVAGIEGPASSRDWWKDAQLAIENTIRDCDKLENSLRGDTLASV